MINDVEINLEQMLPDLDSLLEKGLFSKDELKQVLHKRRKFEYAIKSASRTAEDFYKYLEFEQKLEELRKIRSGKKKFRGERARRNEVCEYCIVKHIHSIYERATFRFKNDVELWKDWFAFCRQSKSKQRLSKALADALRYNPGVPELWIYAARWELEERQNVAVARSLMMQGIRNCMGSAKMKEAFLKMESEIAQKLEERKRVLFTQEPEPVDGKDQAEKE